MTHPGVTRHAAIMSGKPCITGTRIPTSAIRRFHEDGYSVADIIKEYPTLRAAQVNDALRYERRIPPASGRWARLLDKFIGPPTLVKAFGVGVVFGAIIVAAVLPVAAIILAVAALMGLWP